MAIGETLLQGVCHLIIFRSKLFGLSIIALSLIFTTIAFIAYPFEIDTSTSTFVPRSSKIYRRQETLLLGEEATRFNPYRNPDEASIDVPLQYTLAVVFEMGGNLFTQQRIEMMNSLKEDIEGIDGFEDVCLKDRQTGQCIKPDSLLPFFFAAPVAGCSGVFNPTESNMAITQPINDVLRGLIDPTTTGRFCNGANSTNCNVDCLQPNQGAFGIYYGKNFGYPDGNTSLVPNLASDVTRITFSFGMPLPGYSDPYDRYDSQIKAIESFVRKTKGVIDGYDEREGVNVYWFSEVLLEDYFMDVILRDTLLIVVSIVMVWLYMTFHLQSLFLSSLGMLRNYFWVESSVTSLDILLSFPIAYLFAQAAMDFGGMSILQLMSLFIILGIGADDVFILVDTWKQSGIEIRRPAGLLPPCNPKDYQSEACQTWMNVGSPLSLYFTLSQTRMKFSYSRAAAAMLITSLTTGAAFVMNLTSAVPAIQIFGGFTAFMVLFNYLLVISWYPCVIVWYQTRFQYWWSPLSWCVQPLREPDPVDPDASQDKVEEFQPGKAVAHVDTQIDEYRALERWFYKVYAPALIKARWFIIAGFAIYFFISLGFATQLSGSDEPAQWLPDSNRIQKLFDILEKRFQRDESVPQVAIIYGLHLVDNTGVNPYNPNDVGKTSFDYHVDFSSAAAQEHFIVLCEEFRTQPYVRDQEVLCPMEEFKKWVIKNGGTFPVSPSRFSQLLGNFTLDYEVSFGPASDFSGSTPATKQDAASREDRGRSEMELYQAIRFDLHDPSAVRYMVIVINTTLPVISSAKKIEPVYNHFEDLLGRMNNRQESVTATLNNGFQTASIYVDMVLEQSLLYAAVVGIAASMSLSFVIILLLTRDLPLSVLSIVSIGGVVTSLIAMMVWMGWELTMVESICMTILVGLSVDYVIHMANAYRESESRDRQQRVRDALVSMGISIVSASITSILSAFVLVFTVITFFFKFGLFIMLTIIFSTLWAFGFFMALMAIVGRHETHDDLTWAWNKMRDMCCPQRAAQGQSVESIDQGADVMVAEFESETDDLQDVEVVNVHDENDRRVAVHTV